MTTLDLELELELSELSKKQRLFLKYLLEDKLDLRESAIKSKMATFQPRAAAINFLTGVGKEAYSLMKQRYAQAEDFTVDWKLGKLYNLVEATGNPSSPHFQPGVTVKALDQMSALQGDKAPVKHTLESTIDVNIGYDFSAMQKPKVIEGSVLPADYISAHEEFAILALP